MTTPTTALDYQGTHRAVPTIDEQGPPTQWPDDDRCWAVYQGKRCAEHSDGAA